MGEGSVTWRVGEVIDGRYRVTQVHEHGGMGLVYRVRHLAWDIDLAVKSPRPDRFRSPDDQRRFVTEAQTWVSLGLHPHVCNCYYVRVLDGVPRVFAEYVPGGSLHEWINDRRLYHGDPSEVLARILDVAIQTARGLDHAHSHGLVHRDVKPANVLLDIEDPGDGSVTAKVTDFGMARARDLAATVSPDAPPGASIPVPGGSGMTPLYASPEQAAGEQVGRRTDVYSFAVSVLEMCAGEVTWMVGPAAGAALSGHRADNPADAVAIPPALGDLLERCLCRNPADRPSSMADVATELIDIYRNVTGHAYPRPAPATADLLTDELNNRAVSLLDLNRPAEADQAFAQALAADPQNARAIYNAGLARWRRGAVTDDALIAEIEATRADSGDPWEVRYVLAQIHLERGDLDTSRTLLDEVARERPDEPEVLAALHLIRSKEIIDARCTREWRVPWPPRSPAPFPGEEHENRVTLALTPDGRLMLSGAWDGTVRFWDVHSGQCLRTLEGHRRPVHAVDLTPDGRFAVSVCEDETVWFWELARSRRFRRSPKGRRLYASPHPPSWDGSDGLGELALRVERTAVRLTPDGRFALYAGLDGTLRVWDVPGGQMRTLDATAAGRLVSVSADGRRALSVGWRGRKADRERVVRLWDLPDGRCQRELTGHESALTALCLSADGRIAATGYHGGTIRVWDLGDGRCVHVLTGGTTPDTLSLDGEARFLMSGGGTDIRLWELDGGRCLRTFGAHQGGTSVVRLDADARFGRSTGQDRTVRRWELPGGYRGTPRLSRPRRHIELSRLGGRVDALVAEAEQAMTGGRLPAALDLLRQARAIEGYERAPRVMSAWWALGRRCMRTSLRTAWSSRFLDGHARSVEAVDLSGDGRIGVSGGADATVRLWDLDGGTCLRVLEGHQHMVESVRLSADGRSVLSSSRDGTVRLWDFDTGACLHVLDRTKGLVYQSSPVRFSPDGRQAVVGGQDGTIRYWDLRTGAPTRELRNRAWGIDDMCVGDDGRLIVTAKGGAVDVWNLADGPSVDRLRGGPPGLTAGRMRTVSLSADGRFALSGDDDGLRLWDVVTGEIVRTFDRPPPRGFHTVRMTADGRFAVLAAHWSPMTVLDVDSGRCMRVLDGLEQGVGCIALTPDGRFLLTGSGSGLRRWELDWELDAPDAADWNDGAAPYLEVFLRRHGPRWTSNDFDALLRRLQDVGYGWLRADGVRAQLDRMAADPPDARVRDFGSLNGTFVNGTRIGQRDLHQTPEQGAAFSFPEHDPTDGDEIPLGDTVSRVDIRLPAGQRTLSLTRCPACDREVDSQLGDRTGEYVCAACQAEPGAMARLLGNLAHNGHRELAPIAGYTLLRELGRGGMGAVYLARHEHTGREMALKVMLPRVAASQAARARFFREVELTAALRHPNVAALYDAGFTNGTFYFTTEYCAAGSLDQLLARRGGRLEAAEAVRLACQALQGLAHAHGESVVHRDLTPHNILLSEIDGSLVAKVGDFGLAKAFDQAGLSGLTRTGATAGKPWYVPRQQVINFRKVTPAVDVWALAACLYHALTGAHPRDFPHGKDPWQVIMQAEPVPIRRREPTIPTALAEVIDEALRESSRSAFQTAEELRTALLILSSRHRPPGG